ncbi:MAG: ATP-dependent DNA helicase RecG, partial [Halanaerobiales bacterium]
KRIVPIYSLTSGLNQKRIRKIMFQALNDYSPHLKDVLPAELKKKYKFRDLPVSLKGLHFPSNKKHYISAHHRMAFEELFLLQLLVLNRKKGFVQNEGIPHKAPGQIIDSFISSLPFTLTSAQKKVWQEIKQDMEKATPMQRLLQGDVGSGKTVIAVLALIESMANGYQGVFMAPTEILAEQHYLRLKEYFQNLDFNIALLIGSINQSQRQEIKENIKNDKIDLVVGTHALFQKDITYNNLGLVVIDEQHRFGVEQRYSLRKKGENPDLLVMTATPIPRSLALTLYGDLDMSLLDEMPPGRKPVKTSWRQKNARPNVYEFVRKKLNEGQQAFVVCPLIEPSEEISAISAQETEKELKEVLLSGFDIEILHSKISPGEKKAIMDDFRQGKIDVLVSTTVVEVGVDVPNASLMVIEDGQRFGLAQLHQLRGRVGRGQHQSYCIVIAQPTTEDSKKRLQVFTETNDGFKIAEADLEIRGPGEFFGTEQHGMPDLKVANIIKDQKILNRARKEAKNIISHGNLKENYSLLYNRLTDLEVKL